MHRVEVLRLPVLAAVNSQIWWWFARATGLVAWAIICASVLWGVALSGRVVRRRGTPAWLLDLHRYLGTLGLVFTALHLLALWADSYVQFGPRELLVPMASTWRPGAVAWGVLGLYVAVVVQVTSWAMRWLPRKVWHSVHLSSFGLFAMVTVHGFLAGADAANQLVQIGAVCGIATVVALVVLRAVNRSGQPAGAAPSGAADSGLVEFADARRRSPAPVAETPVVSAATVAPITPQPVRVASSAPSSPLAPWSDTTAPVPSFRPAEPAVATVAIAPVVAGAVVTEAEAAAAAARAERLARLGNRVGRTRTS